MNWTYKEINYFDFLLEFPEVVDTFYLPAGIDPLFYIEYVKEIHKTNPTKKPLIILDNVKLSEVVHRCIKTNEEKFDIFRGYLSVKVNNDEIFHVKPTKNLLSYERNNLKELEGEFTIISSFPPGYYNFDEVEMKNLKRDLLIGKMFR
jgi:hypothetical protein